MAIIYTTGFIFLRYILQPLVHNSKNKLQRKLETSVANEHITFIGTKSFIYLNNCKTLFGSNDGLSLVFIHVLARHTTALDASRCIDTNDHK